MSWQGELPVNNRYTYGLVEKNFSELSKTKEKYWEHIVPIVTISMFQQPSFVSGAWRNLTIGAIWVLAVKLLHSHF
jgi:hypothetical protein